MPPRRSIGARITLWRVPRGLAIAVAVVLLAVVGGGYFAAQRGAKRLIEPLRWFGAVEYDRYDVGFSGTVTFENLRVTPSRGGQLIAARRVVIETPGLPWLMMAARYGTTRTDRGTLAAFFGREGAGPAQVPAAFPAASSLRVTLHEPSFGDAVRRFADLEWLSLDVAAPFGEAGCAQARPFQRADLRAMRLPDNPLRVELGVLQTSSDQSRIDARFVVDDVSSAALSMQLRWPEPQRILDANWNQVVLLERRWDLLDLGWVGARNRYCAKRLGVTRDDFIERHVDAVRVKLAELNATPSADVLGTYRRYLLRGGELHWRAAPSPAMALGQFAKFRPAEKLRILNASLEAVKGRAVRFAFDFTAPVPLATNPDGTAIAAVDPALSMGPPAPGAPPPATTTADAAGAPTAIATVAPPSPATAPPIGSAASPGVAAVPPANPADPNRATLPSVDATGALSARATSPPASPPARAPAKNAPRIDPLNAPVDASAAIASSPRVASIPKPDPSDDAERVMVKPSADDAIPDELVYEDLEHFVGRRVVLRSRYNSLRSGVLLKYTSVAITLKLDGRQQGLELSMPRQTVREVVSVSE